MRRWWWALLLACLAAPGFAEEDLPYVPQVWQIPVPPPVVLPAPGQDVPPEALEPLTAGEAARLALYHNYEIRVARSGQEAARGRTQQVGAPLNPHLRLNASTTESLLGDDASRTSSLQSGGFSTGVSSQASEIASAAGGSSSGSSYSLGASLSQLLFDFGHTRALARQAQAREVAAGANLTRVQADLVLAVKQSFYQFVQASRLVQVQESNLNISQAQLELARGRFQTGLGLPADVVRAETAVTAAISALAQARNDANLARVDLAQRMGIDPRTPLVPAASSEGVTPLLNDPEALFARAVESRAELAQAEAEILASRHGLDAAHTTSAPSLTTSLSYNRRGQSSFTFDQLLLTIGIQVELFDGGLTAGRVQEAEANLESARAQLEGTRDRILAEVARAYLNLETAQQRLVAARAQEANASEALRLATGRYRVGLGILLEVLDAKNALLTAEVSRVNAEAALEQARAALNHAVGTALPEQKTP